MPYKEVKEGAHKIKDENKTNDASYEHFISLSLEEKLYCKITVANPPVCLM